jgi:hypothetical protein
VFELGKDQATTATFIDDVSIELAGQQMVIADCTHQVAILSVAAKKHKEADFISDSAYDL